ncbi:MAG: thioredoxin domain-containing protein, partial [Planctomycetes bacterium]|nr:thioredoxin domain-containing protein [Planctomycetota bacterium]
DYAFCGEGLINLHEATFDPKWLAAAAELTDVAITHYYDRENGAFFFTADDAEELLARTKSPRDGAIPSGNSVLASNLLRLAILLDRPDFREKADSIMRAFKPLAERSPMSFERLMCAVDFRHGRPKEIVVIGPSGDAATQALLDTVFARYLPNKVVVWNADDVPAEDTSRALLRGKKMIQGRPTAYVCENFRCQVPTSDPEELAKQLAAN